VLAALVRKELRDQRGLLLLAGGLFALVVVGARLVLGASFDAELRSQRILPFALGIVAAVLAAESIGRDASAGVESLWERLPVDRALVWGAKVAAVVAGALLFLGGALLVELALRAMERAAGPAGAVALLPSAWWLLVVPCVTAAVLFWSALLRWSLAATLMGVGCVALPPLVWDQLSGRLARFLFLVMRHGPRPEWKWLVIATAAGITGSLLAFRVRGWWRLSLRRALAGAMGLLLVLLPTAARPMAVALARLELGLFDPDAELVRVEPSPDGRHLAVIVQRTYPTRSLTDDSERRAGILDRRSGTWRELGSNLEPVTVGRWPHESVWSLDGLLAVVQAESPGRPALWELIDPTTGHVAWQATSARLVDLSSRMGQVPWLESAREGDEYVLRWEEREIELRIPKSAWLARASEPGIVFLDREGTVVRHDLSSGEERVVFRGSTTDIHTGQLSPDDRWIAFGEAGDRVVLEVSSGRVVHRVRGGLVACWCREPGRVALVQAGSHRRDDLRTILLLEDGTSRLLAPGTGRWAEDGPDAFLHYEHRSQRLERIGLDGKVLEVLLPPDSRRS